ncbi:uncharacterized protein [Nicotiana tomentosiformis]|uniref:uncharacterized protein n=1 Tax=Nicotiana tomentosiformis TaxID=4098 RepID=UPI00051B6EF6|nr:uncharacterized protein LOC104111051 isoform X1 [Nicotiana tomentosiformis]
MLRTSGTIAGVNSGLRRFLHITARPSPLDSVVNQPTATSPSLVLPENDNNNNSNSNIGYMFPNSPVIGGSMKLMAVPKKKRTLFSFVATSSKFKLQGLWSSQIATFLLLQWD